MTTFCTKGVCYFCCAVIPEADVFCKDCGKYRNRFGKRGCFRRGTIFKLSIFTQ